MRSMENLVKGLKVGESKSEILGPAQAFGMVQSDIRIPQDQIPPDLLEKMAPEVPILTQQGNVLVVRKIDDVAKDVIFDPIIPWLDTPWSSVLKSWTLKERKYTFPGIDWSFRSWRPSTARR